MTSSNLTPRERVEKALRGGHADRVPFTVYQGHLLPRCAVERDLRNRGCCIVERGVPVWKEQHPNVKATSLTFVENGKTYIKSVYETPDGNLERLSEPAGFTSWTHKHYFRDANDYKALMFYIKDAQYEASYEAAARAQELDGGDSIFRAALGLEPLQTLISQFMGTETFCMEWMTNRDEILKLYDAIVEKRRQVYPIVAGCPYPMANYGGNVVQEIVGREVFEEYYVPNYNEAAEELHKGGVLIGCHLDSSNSHIASAIASTDLDYIEAFTPAPDTDMTLREAREAWPDKVLWLNYPSSWHLHPDEKIVEKTVGLVNELDSVDGLIVGITETIPEHRWRGSCAAIMDGLDRHAAERPEMYD